MSNASKKTMEEGARVKVEDTEMMLLDRLQNATNEDDHFRWLLFVVGYYRGAQRTDTAKALLQRFLSETKSPEYKVHCHLGLGQIATDEKDYEAALHHFNGALTLKPSTKKLEYVLLNNAGYCLNMLGRFAEGERHCRKALEVDWLRPSAYRNLGVSLHGNGNIVAAAWALVEAAKADPTDDRARSILHNLLSMNPELVVAYPWIMDGLDPAAAKLVETAFV